MKYDVKLQESNLGIQVLFQSGMLSLKVVDLAAVCAVAVVYSDDGLRGKLYIGGMVKIKHKRMEK
jgi:hypothetical protein